MVRKGDSKFVLWPRYFDARLSRAEGRRVPEDLAVEKPDASWIEAAAKKAGLSPDLEEKSRDPAKPYVKSGRVLVAKKGPKEAAIRAVAEQMAKRE